MSEDEAARLIEIHLERAPRQGEQAAMVAQAARAKRHCILSERASEDTLFTTEPDDHGRYLFAKGGGA